MKRIILFLVLSTLVLSARADVGFLAGVLTGDQVVPATESYAEGTIVITFNTGNLSDINSIYAASVYLTFNGPAPISPTQIFIRRGAPGENGPAVYTLHPGSTTLSITNPSQAEELISGNMYVEVQSNDYPDGEIRGQIIDPRIKQLSLHADLTPDGAIYPIPGTGTADITYDMETKLLSWNITTSFGEDAQHAVIDLGRLTFGRYGPSLPSPVVLALPSGSLYLPYYLSDNFISLLLTGNMDVSIETSWITGQLVPLPDTGGKWRVDPPQLGLSLAPGDEYLDDMTVLPPRTNWLFVIDNTGSMGNEIAAIKATVHDIVDSVRGTEREPDRYIITRFGDPYVSSQSYSREEVYSFLANLDSLYASGGGDCPEYAITGIRDALALQPIDPGATNEMFFFTDAGVKDANSVPDNLVLAKAELRAKGVRLHAVIAVSGCNYLDPTYPELARQTGGLYQIADSSTIQVMVDSLLETMSSGINLDHIPVPNACGPLSVSFDPASGKNTTTYSESIIAPYTAFSNVQCSVGIEDNNGGLLTTQDVSITAVVVDSDNDGVLDDVDNCPIIPNPDQANADGDAAGDACDAFPTDPAETTDSDGDGVGDNADAFPNDPNETADSDSDGVGDHGDNCPAVANADQSDLDGDGVGDACDAFPNDPSETADSDGDGVGDNADAFPNDPSETVDSDGDGVGDNSDPFPDSDNSPSVDVGGIDAGVQNRQFDDGTTLADVVNAAFDTCNGTDGADCMSDALNDLKDKGVITGAEKGALQSAAAKQQGKKKGK